MRISFPLLLFLVFMVLKLTQVIDWSWWWITAPLWAGLAIYLLFVFGVVLIAVLAKTVLWFAEFISRLFS